MTTRIAGDSTTITDIPLTVDAVLAYGNGAYTVTVAEVEARFPIARYGRGWIDVLGTGATWADILDVERYDATPQQAPGWIREWHAHHPGIPIVYCNESTLPAVVAECSAAGLKRGIGYGLWVATLSGVECPHVEGDGIVACQRDGEAQTGAHWDRSLIYDPNLWLPRTDLVKPPSPTLAEVIAAGKTVVTYLEGLL